MKIFISDKDPIFVLLSSDNCKFASDKTKCGDGKNLYFISLISFSEKLYSDSIFFSNFD